MPDLLMQHSQGCSDLQSVLDGLLRRSLELTGTGLGNVQMMDWEKGYLRIAAHHGFNDEFLNFFRHVRAQSGSACARAITRRESIVIEDVLVDPEFAPYRMIALRAGFRAVQSTPLISSGGAFFGVVSTHFPAAHKPSGREIEELGATGQRAADAIIRLRVHPRATDGRLAEKSQTVAEQVRRGREAVARSAELIRRIDLLLNR